MEIVEIYEGFVWSVKYEGEKDDIFSSLITAVPFKLTHTE